MRDGLAIDAIAIEIEGRSELIGNLLADSIEPKVQRQTAMPWS